MARGQKKTEPKNGNGAKLSFEQTLWAAADKLRGHLDAAEYKHVVLGLIFLKYISDAFSELYNIYSEQPHVDPEDRDEYMAENVFWVPKEARWSFLQANAKQPTIGKFLDDAMDAIEKENPSLKGVLPKDYNKPALDKQLLGEIIDLIAKIGLGDAESRSKDILGGVYEYFLGQFANAEGKRGGQFYTPRCVVQLLVEMIEPYKGRIYDPCCGSGGMFVQSEKFVEAHGGKVGDISIYGQESNPTTWKLCKMNLALRGIEGNMGDRNADTFHNDLHKDLKADFILANPPFNMSDWGGDRLREDTRWKYGTPPMSNANYAWVMHKIHHLAPNGIAGFVLANGSMSSNQSGEGDIRQLIIDADLVDCMVALPGQLFYNTQIPACLWFLARNKKNGLFRDHTGETLFIDARKMGVLLDRVHRELTVEDIKRIAQIYHAWRGEKEAGEYEDIPGFCKSTKLQDIVSNNYVLAPGLYVEAEGIEEVEFNSELSTESNHELPLKKVKQLVHFSLFVPDRFHALQKRGQDMLNSIVVPVSESLNRLDEIFLDMSAAGRGAFLVLRGDSGSGKSTFLNTLHLFRTGIKIVSISSEDSIFQRLKIIENSDVDLTKIQILVIEGREALTDLSQEQLEKDIHSINSFIRSTTGERTLVVWLCNTDELQKFVIELALKIGFDSLLGVEEPSYQFTGPPKKDYLDIAKRTISTLNEGASLIDLGISEERAIDLVSNAKTIGFYLSLLRQELLRNQKSFKSLLAKEQCRMWVVVITGNDREDFVASLTRGRSSTADIDRLMVATEANIVKEIKTYSDKTGILATTLDVRIIHLPILTALAIARKYADKDLEAKMKVRGMSTKQDLTAEERLTKSDLAKAFESLPMGLAIPGRKPVDSTKEAFDKLLRITQDDDALVNKTIGRALKACDLIDSFETEVDFGEGLTRKTDICCQSQLGLVRLELMWRKNTSRAEIANYVLTKLYNYAKAIGHL